jgi:hypothetical protein
MTFVKDHTARAIGTAAVGNETVHCALASILMQ